MAQASLALVQISVPFWTGQRTRVSIMLGLTGFAFVPSLLVLVLLAVIVSPVVGLLAAPGRTLVTGTILMFTVVKLFDRMEFSG